MPSVDIWVKSYQTSPVPIIILDKALRIVWVNSQFEILFGQLEKYNEINLNSFYKKSFDEEKRLKLLQNVQSQDHGYTWKGQCIKKSQYGITINSNLLILPIFKSLLTTTGPIGYSVILDDVSGEYKKIIRNTFFSLLQASRLKDNDTGNHVERVNKYSRFLTESLIEIKYSEELDMEFYEEIGFLAALHDVGKIGTPDDILNKAGPLNAWEWDIMKQHTINGAYILSTYPSPMAKDIALNHHEKWNGTGYPNGLFEAMTPLSARIVSVADVYDALRMKRSYKDAYSHEKSVNIMQRYSGINFDPEILKCFLLIHKKFSEIFSSMQDM